MNIAIYKPLWGGSQSILASHVTKTILQGCQEFRCLACNKTVAFVSGHKRRTKNGIVEVSASFSHPSGESNCSLSNNHSLSSSQFLSSSQSQKLELCEFKEVSNEIFDIDSIGNSGGYQNKSRHYKDKSSYNSSGRFESKGVNKTRRLNKDEISFAMLCFDYKNRAHIRFRHGCKRMNGDDSIISFKYDCQMLSSSASIEPYIGKGRYYRFFFVCKFNESSGRLEMLDRESSLVKVNDVEKIEEQVLKHLNNHRPSTNFIVSVYCWCEPTSDARFAVNPKQMYKGLWVTLF